MQRYLPPDAKRREIIEAKKVKRTGPLAKFVDLHDPSLLDDTKIRFAHNTSSLKIPNENSAQKSRFKKKANGLLVGPTLGARKESLISKHSIYINDPNVKDVKHSAPTKIQRSASAPLVVGGDNSNKKGGGILVNRLERRKSAPKDICPPSKTVRFLVSPASKSPDFGAEKTILPSNAFTVKPITWRASSAKMKWSIERERRAQLIHKLKRPSSGMQPQDQPEPIVTSLDDEHVNDSIEKALGTEDLAADEDVILQDRVNTKSTQPAIPSLESAAVNSDGDDEALDSSKSEDGVQILPLKNTLKKGSTTLQGGKVLGARIAYGSLPIRKLYLFKRITQQRSEVDLKLEASIHGLEISSAPMYEPKVKTKVLVSKPSPSQYSQHSLNKLNSSWPDLEIEMMPSESIPDIRDF